MDFQHNYVLENDSVRLRPLTVEDLEILSVFAIEEPMLWKYSLISADGIDNMKRYLEYSLEDRRQERSYPFIVFDKRTQEYAGSTRFYDYQKNHNTTQLGFTWYGKRFWGTGLNKNCKYLMLSFAFEELNLHRVEFRADAKNARSIAAMKGIGCQVEGILRSNCASRLGRRDSIVLSILRDEWFTKVKNELAQKLTYDSEK